MGQRSEQTCPASQFLLESSYPSKSHEHMVGALLLWWNFACTAWAELSWPQHWAVVQHFCIVIFYLLLLVKSVHLQPGWSHCTDYHRQATWAVQENRKAEAHLIHRRVSYSPWVLLTGVSRSRSFPSQDCSWTSKVKATCYAGYLGINEEL